MGGVASGVISVAKGLVARGIMTGTEAGEETGGIHAGFRWSSSSLHGVVGSLTVGGCRVGGFFKMPARRREVRGYRGDGDAAGSTAAGGRIRCSGSLRVTCILVERDGLFPPTVVQSSDASAGCVLVAAALCQEYSIVLIFKKDGWCSNRYGCET